MNGGPQLTENSRNSLAVRSLGLFLCLSSMFLLYPHLATSNSSRLLLDSIFTVSIACSLFQDSGLQYRVRISYVTTGILAISSTWLAFFSNVAEYLVPISYSVFFGTTVLVHLRTLFADPEVHWHTLVGAACTYILIGLFFASINAVLLQLDPQSMVLPKDETEPFFQLIYFSFVTLTTVGYGDVLPASNAARMLAAYEAVIGQSYVAVVVGLLVGKHKGSSDRTRAGSLTG
ncbi:MAG: potassium channel family protein [Planctomycetota bacterium]